MMERWVPTITVPLESFFNPHVKSVSLFTKNIIPSLANYYSPDFLPNDVLLYPGIKFTLKRKNVLLLRMFK